MNNPAVGHSSTRLSSQHRRAIPVLFDGIIYGLQRRGGISRCFNELLFHLDQSSGIQPVLKLPGTVMGMVPEYPHILYNQNQNTRFMSRLLTRIGLADYPGIFHSTYYTLPERGRQKSVVTVHDFIHERFPEELNDAALMRRKQQCIESADVVITVSHAVREEVLQRFRIPDDRVVVAYHGVSSVFAESAADAGTVHGFFRRHGLVRPYWLHVGQRSFYKNFVVLLESFARLADSVEFDLVAVGGASAWSDTETALIHRYGLQGRVHLLDLEDGDLRLAYQGAEAFVFPSLAEGFGIPLIEAMACNTPIVAADIQVFREVAGDAAVYFDPFSTESLCEALLHALESDVRTTLLTNARTRIGRFSWKRFADIHTAVYRQL